MRVWLVSCGPDGERTILTTLPVVVVFECEPALVVMLTS